MVEQSLQLFAETHHHLDVDHWDHELEVHVQLFEGHLDVLVEQVLQIHNELFPLFCIGDVVELLFSQPTLDVGFPLVTVIIRNVQYTCSGHSGRGREL